MLTVLLALSQSLSGDDLPDDGADPVLEQWRAQRLDCVTLREVQELHLNLGGIGPVLTDRPTGVRLGTEVDSEWHVARGDGVPLSVGEFSAIVGDLDGPDRVERMQRGSVGVGAAGVAVGGGTIALSAAAVTQPAWGIEPIPAVGMALGGAALTTASAVLWARRPDLRDPASVHYTQDQVELLAHAYNEVLRRELGLKTEQTQRYQVRCGSLQTGRSLLD
jgi:hypothetical protein